MKNMDIFNFTREGIADCKINDFLKELGYRVLYRLCIPIEAYDALEAGRKYYLWRSEVSCLSPDFDSDRLVTFINDIATCVVPAYFIQFAMTQGLHEFKSFASRKLIIKEFILLGATVEVELYHNPTESDLSNKSFTVTDVTGVSKNFIYVDLVAKTVSDFHMEFIQSIFAEVGKSVPIFFAAWYAYRAVYDTYYANGSYSNLLENLRDKYQKELNAVSLEKVFSYDEEILMCIFPEGEFMSKELKHLKAEALDEKEED